MALEKVMFTDKKGAWRCTDCGMEWDFDITRNPNPARPQHDCPKNRPKRGEPAFPDSDEVKY